MLNFYKKSESLLINLADQIEKIDIESIFDVEYFDGILTISINANNQEYVINRNSANQKIWYSSPLSGADYFSFDEDKQKWINNNNEDIEKKLFIELNSFISK